MLYGCVQKLSAHSLHEVMKLIARNYDFFMLWETWVMWGWLWNGFLFKLWRMCIEFEMQQLLLCNLVYLACVNRKGLYENKKCSGIKSLFLSRKITKNSWLKEIGSSIPNCQVLHEFDSFQIDEFSMNRSNRCRICIVVKKCKNGVIQHLFLLFPTPNIVTFGSN